MQKVMIATPSYDGKLQAWYTDSLIRTIDLGFEEDIYFQHIFMCNDSLVQRARNDLMRLAMEGDFEAILWIDSDMVWDPNWAIEIVKRYEDIVGGTARKKTDEKEIYVTNLLRDQNLTNGLIRVKSLGTGFVKMSRVAFTALWENSKEYFNEGKISRMVFDIQIIDGQLFGEDTVIYKKLSELGFGIWLDPKMTCHHIGSKIYSGNFEEYLKKLA